MVSQITSDKVNKLLTYDAGATREVTVSVCARLLPTLRPPAARRDSALAGDHNISAVVTYQ